MAESKIRIGQVSNLQTQLGTIYTQANNAYDAANTANGTGAAGYAQANAAYAQANAARNQANSAYGQANLAYDQANAAYLAANNANLLLGGVITGTLNVTQDIIVGGNVYLEGNTTFINVTTYSIEDSLIYLASNNELTDSVDIGFMGGKNTSGTYAHTGLARDATDGKWKLFDGLPEEGHVGNVINFNNSYLATLVANVEANTLSVVNGVSGNVDFDNGTLFVDSVGNNVGIGTTSPATRFHVYVSGGGLELNPAANTTLEFIDRANTNATVNTLLYTRNGFFAFHTGGYTERLRISNDGNVGIGTTNPAYKLDVNGIVNIAQGSYLRKAFADNTEEFLIRGDATSWNGFISYTPSGGTSNRGFKFGAWDNVGFRNDWLTIWNGDVGIGTTTPSQKLHVEGGSALIKNGTSNVALWLGNSAYGFELEYSNGKIHTTINSAKRVTVDNSGNVGIGTVSPAAKFHLYNGVAIFNNNSSGDSNSGLRIVAPVATTHYNWMLGAQQNVGNAFEITPSTAVGGTTFTTPVAVFTQAGQVGIGTVTPGRRFHTYVNGADVARFEGSSYYIDIDGNGNQITGSNGLAFRGTTTGGAHLQITSGGNVGIGTTNPLYKFHVFNNSGAYATWIEHNVNNAGQSFYDALFLQNANAGDDRYVQIGFSTNSSVDGQHHRATIRAYRDTAATYGGKLGFFTRADGGSLNERITINAAGNVGIGYTSPQKKLDVNGSGIVASFGSTFGVGAFAGIHFGYSESSAANDIYKKSALVFERTDAYGQGGNAGGKIHFLLNNTGSASAGSLNDSVMTIDSDASGTVGSVRLGIGTRNPIAPLTFPSDALTRKIVLWWDGSNNNDYRFYGFGIEGSTLVYSVYGTGDNHVFFAGTGNASRNELMRIMGDGRVGIGTASPGYRLEVYQASNDTTIRSRTGGAGAWIETYDTTQYFSGIRHVGNNGARYWLAGMSNGNADYCIAMSNNGSTNRYFTIDGSGNVSITGTLTENSSATIKENINPITNALDSILQLVGVVYDRKDGSAKQRAGLIAEEVEQVLPNVVQKDQEGNPSGIQYTNLIAYLIESIKELKAEIDELKRK